VVAVVLVAELGDLVLSTLTAAAVADRCNYHRGPPVSSTLSSPIGAQEPRVACLRGTGSPNTYVPTKLPNNAGEPVAEVVEGRGRRKGNVTSKSHPGHSAGQGALCALAHVRRAGPRPDPAPDPSEEPSAVVPHAGICAGGHPKGWSLPRPRQILRGHPFPHDTRLSVTDMGPCVSRHRGPRSPA